MDTPKGVYRIRKYGKGWFVLVYKDYSLNNLMDQLGPYNFEGANQKAVDLDIPDGDKGPSLAHIRGHNATR